MLKPPARWLAFPLLLALLLRAGPLPGDEDASSGAVVEEVAKGSAAERAGVEAGDVIFAWSRAAAPAANAPAAEGRIASVFDLAGVAIEQVPRGPVALAGSRGGRPMIWTVQTAPFGLTIRPRLEPDLFGVHQEARDLVRSRRVSEGAGRWRAAADTAKARGQGLVAAWFLARAAGALSETAIWLEADAAYEAAVRELEAALRPASAAELLRQWAEAWRRRSEWARFEDAHRRALALDEGVAPESLAVARDLNGLGVWTYEYTGPAASEEYYRRALAIKEALAPGSRTLAVSLDNLGHVARDRGDLAAAEEYHKRALAIEERLDPESLSVAAVLNSLGVAASARSDLAAAEEYFRRSLAIRERTAPGSLDLANSLNNLGAAAFEGGDLAKAEDSLRRALVLTEELTPDSAGVATALVNLGEVAGARGDLNLAEEHYRRAVGICDRVAPGGTVLASALEGLGGTATRRGHLPAAEEYHRRALAIREAMAPGSADEARSLHALGLILRRTGRVEEAAALLLRALAALESQKTKLGGTQEARSGFAARHAAYYHDSLEVLIGLGRAADALHVLERSRARALLALLAERDLLFSADLPPELARERRLADAEYDRVQASVAALDPAKDAAELQELLGRQRELREKQEEIGSRIRRASPHFASLHYPEPLSLAGVRGALDAGTVLLSYSVGAERTVLFAAQSADVPGPGLAVFSIPIGEKDLRQKVEALRRSLQSLAGREVLTAQAAELYDLLVRPAESQIARGERLLLSADGPLLSLPFAALVRRGPGGRGAASYLIEWKPLHSVASATVYAELKRSRRAAAAPAGRLVAFGDPHYPSVARNAADPIANPDLRDLARSFGLTPLPFSRQEVDAIARLFPGRSRTYVGAEATEGRARTLDKDARYIHFACHGYLDERFPLNSALALSIPEWPAAGEDNGLLQAWEIFDKVRIDADLVTLSACNTALGREMGGEGLLGLTRAFHYSGARSVLATLWAVSDRRTPLLMERFYAHLEAGKSRDAALQAAQLDFIRARPAVRGRMLGTHVSHPFCWATLQLSGDWR